jgi:hypothetical protein
MKTKVKVLRQMFRNGRATAEQLVREASKKSHEMHDDFEWDDRKAGHAYRVDQARKIISSVEIILTQSTKVIRTVAYVRDPSCAPKQQGYISVDKLKSERALAGEALENELDRVIACYERASAFADALDLRSQFDAVLLSAVDLRSLIKRKRKVTPE